MPANYIAIIALLFLGIYIWWRLFFSKKKTVLYIISEDWKQILLKKVVFYRQLSEKDKPRFEQDIMQFLADVKVTGVEIELDDTDLILVASSAVIPLFGFPTWRYRNIKEVLLYKGTFTEEFETKDKDKNVLGMVGEGAMNKMMILSKPALHLGFENQTSKSNVGIHEFVHLIDKADGSTDGIPESLMKRQYVLPWLHYMHQEIQNIKDDKSDINPYGAKSESEFLSVVSEYFFNRPDQFEIKHPELYLLLSKIYRQDL